MANSLVSLLQVMQQGSVTQGWGAVSVFSRAQLNRLLEQQYIERFQRLAFLPSFMGDVNLGEQQDDIASLARIRLGPPLLSFNNATLTNSTALLGMNIVAGSYSVHHRAAGLAKRLSTTFTITEDMGFRLEMDIDLSMVVGEISKHGKVVLDLASGVRFRCNLAGSDTSTNEHLAGFFKQAFAALPPHRSVFELGMLDFKGYNAFTPQSFKLATQAAPGAKVRGAKNFGEGAVVVFIRLQGNSSDGDYPPLGNFPYLIPDDLTSENTAKYTASLIVAHDSPPADGGQHLEVLNSLLFPGTNVFSEVERHTPFDLAVFGVISPEQTSLTLDPLFKTIRAGESQQFTLRDVHGKVIKASSWQAISLQSHTPEGHGSITSDGLYTAVTAAAIGHDSLRVVISATYGDDKKPLHVSALLLVVFDAMQLVPRMSVISGRSQQPVALAASSLAGNVAFALHGAQYGELSDVADGAVFTPDARGRKKALLVQQVEATGTEKRTASLLLVNGQQLLNISPDYVPRLGQSQTVQLQQDDTFLPGLERRWKVLGGGGSVDPAGKFTSSVEGQGSSSVVSCELVGNGVVFSTGYSVVELSDMVEEPTWKELSAFTVKVPGGPLEGVEGGLYPNGYQQLTISVYTKTEPVGPVGDSHSYPLSPEEKASMVLVDTETGQSIWPVSSALDGIPEGDENKWLVRETRNRFQLANTGAALLDGLLAEDGVSNQDFYLHSREEPGEETTFHAAFTVDNTSAVRTSTQLEDKHSRVKIKPWVIPDFNTQDYTFMPIRLGGAGSGGNPSVDPPAENEPDNPFDLHPETIDYWKLSFKGALFETVEFVKDNKVDDKLLATVSMILWESEQAAETMFSWTGYIFDDVEKQGDIDNIKFDDALGRVVGSQQSLTIPVDKAVFETGGLVVSLHRAANIEYISPGDAARDKLSNALAVILIDKNGNAHKRLISFLSGVVGRRNRLVHTLFTPTR